MNIQSICKKSALCILFGMYGSTSLLAEETPVAPPEPKIATNSAMTNNSIHWLSNYNDALKEASQNNLPLYLSFTAPDWCTFCKIMEEKIYSTKEFQNIVANKLVFVQLLVPKSGEPSKEMKSLLNRFHIEGIPTTIVLSSDGSKEIARFGYTRMPPKAYAEHVLESISEKK